MDSLKNSIIVAYDFTEVAMNAVAHAVYLAKNFNTALLHIVKKASEIGRWSSNLKLRSKRSMSCTM